jgi:hypothetical protein
MESFFVDGRHWTLFLAGRYGLFLIFWNDPLVVVINAQSVSFFFEMTSPYLLF